MLESHFKLSELGSTLRTEVVAPGMGLNAFFAFVVALAAFLIYFVAI